MFTHGVIISSSDHGVVLSQILHALKKFDAASEMELVAASTVVVFYDAVAAIDGAFD